MSLWGINYRDVDFLNNIEELDDPEDRWYNEDNEALMKTKGRVRPMSDDPCFEGGICSMVLIMETCISCPCSRKKKVAFRVLESKQ